MVTCYTDSWIFVTNIAHECKMLMGKTLLGVWNCLLNFSLNLRLFQIMSDVNYVVSYFLGTQNYVEF